MIRPQQKQQKKAHQTAYADKQQRINRGVDDALADGIHLGLVVGVARKGRAEIAGSLAHAHGGDVERRKSGRKLLQRARERASLAKNFHHARQHRPEIAAALLFRERIDRLDERQPRARQHQKLLAEKQHGKPLAAAAPKAERLRLLPHRENGVTAALGLLARARLVECLEVKRLDAAVLGDRPEFEAHRELQ